MGSSEEIGLVPSQRLENGLNSHLVFPDDALRFNCGAPVAQRRAGPGGAEVPKTRDLSGFIDERFFAPTQTDTGFRRNIYGGGRDRRDPPEERNWNGNGPAATPSVDGSEEDDDDDDDDVDDDDDDVVGGDDGAKGNNGINGSNDDGKFGNGKQKHHNHNQSQSHHNHHHHHHHFGVNTMVVGSSSRDIIVKESGIVQQTGKASPSRHDHRLSSFHQNAVTVAENDGAGDAYYSQYFQPAEGGSAAAAGHKDLSADNGCGFSGRKDGSFSNESGDSLRTILSDPVTGALMDDAMILPCGHSFGGGGIQQVVRMKSCSTCSQPISEDSIAPNLSLRAAVQAFRREEELQFQRSSKRKRERFDQDKSIYGDSGLMELPRGRGVQFPFSVTDRVIIKGNKRTPQRFVGREAVVTTQCLNGWYVVKTLDNAESVKLQYRSLAKVPSDTISKPTSSKMPPNWL